ncbi:N-acetylmuramoyl-L-alanine amidase [Hathewaya histolytica]|uniref:N-acetylmuramoyl-L-alanine amidase n=1 Tax=Hathewaya histolytica TaxID=1498 RepID=A0A4U9R6N1_HATHI|nr:N-acetylmuramoyl-L-alanine amidase [Hathewaya histolytica]VTQ87075.1 N-acetylmuramoyl-L-alanine amidase [Hathewaya histolytica]
MSIYGIDAGHCLSGADTGAQGNGLREELMTREIANEVSRRLQSLGHKVINCTRNSAGSVRESLNYRVNTANNSNVDMFVSIHINAGGGKGSEIYTYGGKQLVEANNILKNLEGLGFYNRGIKNGSNLAVIRGTRMKSMLIEVCFIDTLSDVNLYRSLGVSKIADAIVKGLVGESVSNTTQNRSINNTNLDGKVGYCTGNDVRIRDARNRDHILGHLYRGDKVKLFRKEGDWMHIYYPPHGGYVHAKYIKY